MTDPERRAEILRYARLWMQLTEPVGTSRSAYEVEPAIAPLSVVAQHNSKIFVSDAEYRCPVVPGRTFKISATGVIPAIPACPVRPQERTFAQWRQLNNPVVLRRTTLVKAVGLDFPANSWPAPVQP